MGRQSRGQVVSRYGRKFDQLGVNTTTVSILQGKRRRTERCDCMDGDAGGWGGGGGNCDRRRHCGFR